MANRPLHVGYVVNTSLDFNNNTVPPNLPLDSLGSVAVMQDDDNGVARYVFVKNVGAVDIAAGSVVCFIDQAKLHVVTTKNALAPAGAYNRVLGVANNVISAGNSGWVQTHGLCPSVHVDTAVSDGEAVVASGSTDGAGAAIALGTALTYPLIGFVVGAKTGNFAPLQLNVGSF
jgi:hypothetical protein